MLFSIIKSLYAIPLRNAVLYEACCWHLSFMHTIVCRSITHGAIEAHACPTRNPVELMLTGEVNRPIT